MFSRLEYEKPLWKRGINKVAGVDEVGRGCLAGPMVVAAVVLNPEHFLNNNGLSDELIKNYTQIKDSKKISANKRLRLSKFIKNVALLYSIEAIGNHVIDTVGISQATQIGFYNSFKKLNAYHVLTDTFEIKAVPKQYQTNIKGGDNISMTIAAASIIAKVYRDELMINFHKKHGVYGFDRHKGYGTKLHKEALEKHGPCILHRMSFEPMKSKYKN